MKRKSVRIQAAKAKPQQLEEEERNTSITNMMSTSLISLPPELVVMVASNLDVSSYLDGFCLLLKGLLGHSCFTTSVECSFAKDQDEQRGI